MSASESTTDQAEQSFGDIAVDALEQMVLFTKGMSFMDSSDQFKTAQTIAIVNALLEIADSIDRLTEGLNSSANVR